MAKETPKKNQTARKKTVSSDVKTVRNYEPEHYDASSTDKKDPKKKPSVKKDVDKKGGKTPDQGVKREAEKKASGAPSESLNTVMPYVLSVIGVLMLLVYVIVLIGNIATGVGDSGYIGNFFHNLIVWVMGWGSYIVPAALFIMALRWRGVSRKGKSHGGLCLQCFSVLLLTTAIFELLFGDHELSWQAYGEALRIFGAGLSPLPGGFLGGAVALIMRWAFRQVFSAIALIALDLFMIMFFVGLTPEVIFHYLKERHEYNRERRAEYLREVEEARRAEAEAAEAERKVAQAAKKEEERLKKEEEAIRRIREKEDKRREEEARAAAERQKQAQLEKELREEIEAAQAKEAVEEEAEDEVYVEESAEADEISAVSAEEESLEVSEEPVKEPEEEPYSEEDEVLPETGHPLATDLDFGLDEDSAKRPKSALPGDDELFGSLGATPARKAVSEVSDDENGVAEESDAETLPSEESSTESVLSEEPEYIYPPTDLLVEGKASADISQFMDEIEAKKEELASVLTSFGVRFRNIEFSRGPTITRYEIQPEPGQRVKAIQNLMDDIALSMAVSGVRFEPSIPGKAAVGIEVPNTTRETVTLRSLVESELFTSEKSKLTACLGADITGKPVVFDVAKMPHLLVAGATGMGKSVCINSIIVSLMYKATPEELRLILVDPKKVEFAMYRDMPHLLTPIITDPQKAAGALCSAVSEMEKRFELIERVGARDIAGYKKITAGDPDMPRMCHIVIIIDELADLMMTASNDVEAAIMRIAQKARAAGIHLIIGTQRPSVDVITGTIKANIPSRIACTVASQTDSRTILDSQGAEKLCGRGDMLFAPVGASRPRRVQGSFVSEDEVVRVVNFMINNNGTALYDQQFMENINIEAERCMSSKKASSEAAMIAESDEDPKLNDAIELAIECGKISTSLMQRRLEVGYGRAAKIIDRMEQLGYVSAAEGNKPRKILVTMEEYRERCAAADAEEEE